MDGDDGLDLMEAFGHQFEVDLSSFQAGQHFGPEGFSIHAPIVWLFWLVSWPIRERQTPEENAGLRAIHIADLITAAEEGKWTL